MRIRTATGSERTSQARRLAFALMWLGVAFTSANASGVEAPDRPAMLRADEWSLSKHFAFPDKTGDFSVAVPCTAHASRQGRLRGTVCLAGDDFTRQIERRIIRAARRAKVTPARFEGRNRSVMFRFTTILERKDGAETVYTLPHHFLNARTLGTSYIAPQVLTHNNNAWPRSCRANNLILHASITRTGAVENPRYHRGNPNARSCLAMAIKYVTGWQYIPGHVDGVPVTMDHLIIMNWRTGWAG